MTFQCAKETTILTMTWCLTRMFTFTQWYLKSLKEQLNFKKQKAKKESQLTMTSILKMLFYCLFIVFKLSLSTFNYISFDKNSLNVFQLNYCWAWVFCNVIIDMTWQWMVFPLVLSCWWWSKLTTSTIHHHHWIDSIGLRKVKQFNKNNNHDIRNT